ncbi:ATP-dependent DNA helicase PIF6-like [Rhizophagus clarus]|uniref:ATP-dependent DNA helicase n=1 Tax=Rhizophagus clarus TaxID=94130 RepID=A0A8H3QP94_9GLOM|nr:ATP-dependent DNA helicase PIF6-like [Rhizophagus clarus]
MYLDARYISASEIIWKIFHYKVHNHTPSIQRLVVYLPNQQIVTFKDEDNLQHIVNHATIYKTTLTACFDDLKTVNGYICSTFKEACILLGLLEDDAEWNICLYEASQIKTGQQLRHLFALILLYCQPATPEILWNNHKLALQNISNNIDNNNDLDQLIQEEISYNTTELESILQNNIPLLNTEQYNIYNTIIQAIEHNLSEYFYIDGSGGTGKTFLYNTILAKISSSGGIALSVASSGTIPKGNLANLIYPNLTENSGNINYMVGRAILTPKNIDVEIISDIIINRLPGETKIYPSLDFIDSTENTYEQQSQVYLPEFLRSLISDLPPGELKLKIGIPIILLRNLNSSEGLCNGTRLIIRELQHKVIDAEIITGSHIGKRVFIP